MAALQPRDSSRLTSSSLRGVPSGLLRSNSILPPKPVTSAINRANSAIVQSSPEPTLTCDIMGEAADQYFCTSSSIT